MSSNRVFAKSKFLTISLTAILAVGPLLQTTIAQKRSVRDGAERAPEQADQPTANAPAINPGAGQRQGRTVTSDVIRPSVPSYARP